VTPVVAEKNQIPFLDLERVLRRHLDREPLRRVLLDNDLADGRLVEIHPEIFQRAVETIFHDNRRHLAVKDEQRILSIKRHVLEIPERYSDELWIVRTGI